MTLAPGVPPYRFGAEDPNRATDDIVTTQMCATAHLDATFANFTARQLGTLPHTAVWPNFKLDYVTLFRQVNFSRARRALRDLDLVLWMLGLVIAWVVIVVQMVLGNIGILAALLAVLAVTLAVYLGAGIVVWYFYLGTMDIVNELVEEPRKAQERLDAFPGLPGRAPGLPPRQLSDAQKAYRGGFVYALARVLAGFDGWYQGIRDELQERNRELWGRRPPGRERALQNQMEYLKALPDANVLLFNRDFKPFELAGVPLDSWALTVDVGKFVDNGKHLTTLSAVTLHHKLLECVKDGSLPLVDARSMYVVSGMQPAERDLFEPWRSGTPGTEPLLDAPEGQVVNPDGRYLEHPSCTISERMIDRLIDNPSEGGRVYAYFRKYSWRGHVVVGAAVRVYRAMNTLHIEFDLHALPPLAGGFQNFLELPATQRTIRQALWRTTVARTPSLLFQSMRSMYMLWCTPSGRMGVTRELQAKREDMNRIDYGSNVNLRLAASDPDELWRFPWVDELDYGAVLRDRVINCIQLFLQSYGVDTTEFDREVWLLRRRQSGTRRSRTEPRSQQDDGGD